MFDDQPAVREDKREVRVYPIWLFQVIQEALNTHPLVDLAISQTTQGDVLSVTTTDRRVLNIEVVAKRPLRTIPDASPALMASIIISLRRAEPLVVYDPAVAVRTTQTIVAVECPLCHERAGREKADDGVLGMFEIDHTSDCGWVLAMRAQVDEVEDA